MGLGLRHASVSSRTVLGAYLVACLACSGYGGELVFQRRMLEVRRTRSFLGEALFSAKLTTTFEHSSRLMLAAYGHACCCA